MKAANKTKKSKLIIGIILIALFSFVFICLISNAIKSLSHTLYGIFGISVFGLVAAGITFSIFLILGKKINIRASYIINFIVMYLLIVLLVHAITSVTIINESSSYSDYLHKCFDYKDTTSTITFGGLLAGVFIYPVYTNLTGWGTFVFLIGGLLATLYIATNFFVKYNSNERQSVFYIGKKEQDVQFTVPNINQQGINIAPPIPKEEHIVKEVDKAKESAINELYGSKIMTDSFDSAKSSAKTYIPNAKFDIAPTFQDPFEKMVLTPEEIEKQKRNEKLIQDFYNLKANLYKNTNTAPIINGDEISRKIREGVYTDEQITPISEKINKEQNISPSVDDFLPQFEGEVFMEVEPNAQDIFSALKTGKKQEQKDFLYPIPKKEEMEFDIVDNENEEIEQKTRQIAKSEDFLDVEDDYFVDVPKATEQKTKVMTTDNEIEPIDTLFDEDETDILEEKVRGYSSAMQQRFSFSKDNAKKPKKEEEDELIIYPPYIAPTFDLLDPSPMEINSSPEEIERNSEILESLLEEFKISATVENVVIGPTVTRYELALAAGNSVKRLQPLTDDIAMRLSVSTVRLETPIPGKDLAGVEVPNKKVVKVPVKTLLDSDEFKNAKGELCFGVGIDINGKRIISDLAKMPHLLVAGSSGSGKSVALNTLLISLLYKYSPEQVRIILVDPKLVEFTNYEGLPHFMINEIISESEKALTTFKWLIDEMERRFKLLKNAGVRDIAAYNKVIDPYQTQRLPRIVLIVDELADLMSYNKSELEPRIMRLAQKSRAAGIHLVLATQRPSVQVISGNIKNNFGCRMALKVASAIDSKTILDFGGAEKLLGRGDMLFKIDTSPDPIRLQSAYIDSKEVNAVVTFIKENNDCHYIKSAENKILKQKDANVILGNDNSEDKFDELFVPALKCCIENKSASISMIQRRFKLGYARAGKIICDMEQQHFITPQDGAKSRQVLISMEQFEQLFGED